jgi:chemotaxis protein histidine kinase CheA
MRTLWIVLAGIVVMAGVASAQDFSEQVEKGLEEMRARKISMVATLIKLEAEEMQAFQSLYDEFQEALREEDERYIEIAWQYLDTSKEMTDDRARTMVREYLDLEEKRTRLKNTYMTQFGEILPPVQLIHLFQLENKAEARFKHDLATHIPILE